MIGIEFLFSSLDHLHPVLWLIQIWNRIKIVFSVTFNLNLPISKTNLGFSMALYREYYAKELLCKRTTKFVFRVLRIRFDKKPVSKVFCFSWNLKLNLDLVVLAECRTKLIKPLAVEKARGWSQEKETNYGQYKGQYNLLN